MDYSVATLPGTVILSLAITGYSFTRTLNTVPSITTNMFLCGEFTFCLQMSKTTMTLMTRVINDIGSGPFEIHTARFDPDDSTIVYCLATLPTNNALKLKY